MKRLALTLVLVLLSAAAVVMCRQPNSKTAEPGGQIADDEDRAQAAPGRDRQIERTQELQPEAHVEPQPMEDEELTYELVVTGVQECDDFIARYMACEKVPDQAKIATQESFEAWKVEAEKGGDASRDSLATMCTASMSTQDESLSDMGC